MACRQVIIYTDAGLLSIGPLGTNFSKIFIHENASENIVCEKAAILSRVRWVNDSVLAATHSIWLVRVGSCEIVTKTFCLGYDKRLG